MSSVLAAVSAIHLAFAALWTGSVLFVTWAVLPLARDGETSPAPMATITSRLKTISRVSAVVLFVTGGHLAGTLYTVDTLTGTRNGYLVLIMLGLWFALAALVEIGASKLADGFEQEKVREPARNARPFFLAASVVAILLLVDAGLLAV